MFCPTFSHVKTLGRSFVCSSQALFVCLFSKILYSFGLHMKVHFSNLALEEIIRFPDLPLSLLFLSIFPYQTK